MKTLAVGIFILVFAGCTSTPIQYSNEQVLVVNYLSLPNKDQGAFITGYYLGYIVATDIYDEMIKYRSVMAREQILYCTFDYFNHVGIDGSNRDIIHHLREHLNEWGDPINAFKRATQRTIITYMAEGYCSAINKDDHLIELLKAPLE